MKVVGICGSHLKVNQRSDVIGEGNLQDSSACLVSDGVVVTAIEEERLNRIKHSNKFPVKAIEACITGLQGGQDIVDCFAFSMTESELKTIFNVPDVRGPMQVFFTENFGFKPPAEKFMFFDHHYCHAASVYYNSGMSESLVMTIDARGGDYSTRIFDANGTAMNPIRDLSPEQSLGYFYSNGVAALGFGYFDEYKVMGLAPYGDPAKYRELFGTFYTLGPEGTYTVYWNKLDVLHKIIPQQPRGAISQVHKDVAAALQEALEDIVFHMLRWFKQQTGHENLCLAGGVAQNCTMNGKIMRSGLFDDVFVFPAPNDSGLSIGAALAAHVARGGKPTKSRFSNTYLGGHIGDDSDIKQELSAWGDFVSVRRSDDIAKETARLIADDHVIGWVQGRSEFGPRSLGNRSILANPTRAENKDRINAMVKKREAFRPFAPAVLQEHATEYFSLSPRHSRLPFMTFVVDVKPEHRHELGAITHVDGTARVQTVSKTDNNLFWRLIDHFRAITGIPVLLNTSFNNNAEPIVDSVKDAVICFLTTKIDRLIVSDLIIEKRKDMALSFLGLYYLLPRHMIVERSQRYVVGPGGDINETVECYLTNTFNNDKIRISEQMQASLLNADGSLTVREAQAGAGNSDSLVREFESLWEKRLIILHPLPVKHILIERSV